jgi:hypothetical protein
MIATQSPFGKARAREAKCAAVRLLSLAGLGVRLQPEGLNNLKNSIKAGGALPGERLIKALAREPGVAGDLCHSFGACDVPQGFCNERGVSVRFLKACFKVSCHFSRRS